MSEPFSVRVAVRDYELDTNGHVASAVYLQYSHHARWECLRAAGIDLDMLADSGLGPVNLEETIRYLSELRSGHEVDVSCRFAWSDGKTFRVEQDLRRPDGTPVAGVTNVGGLIDLRSRRLVPDPARHWRAAATRPELLGL